VRRLNREAISRRGRTTKPEKKRGRRPKFETRRWAPFLAFSFVGALALVAALPANAQLSSTTVAEVVVQEITSSSAQASSSRDGISSVKTSGRQSGGSNYINNPNSVIQWPFHETWPFGDTFGPRDTTGCGSCSSFESGIDIMAPEGLPILAIADGVVSDVHPDNDNSYGVHVTIDHVINGEVFQSNYNHMLEGSIIVQAGQQIKLGQSIGQVGNTGASTAPHTCFLILIDGTPVDPYPWMIQHNV
jgi:murein DD-endopeptidase MepM/ murein hydrolase activator NlpD